MASKSTKGNEGLIEQYLRIQSYVNYLILAPLIIVGLKCFEGTIIYSSNPQYNIYLGFYWCLAGAIIYAINHFLWKIKWKKEALQYSINESPEFELDNAKHIVYSIIVENNGQVNIKEIDIQFDVKSMKIVFADMKRIRGNDKWDLEPRWSSAEIKPKKLELAKNTSVETIILADINDRNDSSLKPKIYHSEYEARLKPDDKERDISTRVVAAIVFGVGVSKFVGVLTEFING